MKTKEELRAYHREWRAKNPEKAAEQMRRYRERHPEKNKEHKRRYYLRHKVEHYERVRAYRAKNLDRLNAAERIAAKAPRRREQRRLAQWKRRYGLLKADALALMAAQHDACAICKTPFHQISKLCVDHCHTSLKVRGFLCNYCNVGIAHFRDNPKLMDAAAAYVRLHLSPHR